VVALRAVDATPMKGTAMNIMSSVEPCGMTFRAPAAVHRSPDRRWPRPKTCRTRDTPRLGNGKPSIMSGIVRIATAFLARSFDLNDEIAIRVMPKAYTPARHPQSIGPVS